MDAAAARGRAPGSPGGREWEARARLEVPRRPLAAAVREGGKGGGKSRPDGRGWVYLASVIDCAGRRCVGWAMADHYRMPLITSAVEMAAPHLAQPEGAIFHSDRGGNYTSAGFAPRSGRWESVEDCPFRSGA